MRTEIQRIDEAIKVYEGYHWRSHKEWLEAERYLLRVYDQYGTINTATIKEIIK